METTANNSTRTDAELLGAIAGSLCLCCGNPKAPGHPFCKTDFLALTLWQRKALGESDKVAFLGAVRGALRHLELHRDRRVTYANTPRGEVRWRHRSDRELEDAGYRLLDARPTNCSAPTCNARIRWWRTPRDKKMAINFGIEPVPHFTTCKDPDYFRRRADEKAVQASAKRKARAASRKRTREIQTSRWTKRGAEIGQIVEKENNSSQS